MIRFIFNLQLFKKFIKTKYYIYEFDFEYLFLETGILF